jgi:hypothetical protein
VNHLNGSKDALKRLNACCSIVTLLSLAATAGCKEASGPTTGAAHVIVATTGIDLDADGYMVTVDGEPHRTVAASDAITFDHLPTGTHTVALIGLTVNCGVSGDNPRSITITRGTITEVAFSVTCVADVGSIHVTAATTGLDLDADGYMVSVDGGASRQVSVNGMLTVSEVRSGDHIVRLDGSAANCTVTESNLKTVAVAFGATAEVTFTVTCRALTGDLRVTTATTGVELDAGGYLVTVDGGSSQVVGVIGAATITGLRAGDHAVALDDVASNCTVDGPNPRTVTVRPDALVELPFSVTCVATTGSLQVTATTTGADPDPNGYVVIVDSCLSLSCDRENGGYELIRTALGANDTAVLSGLAPRDYWVALDGVAANCAARPSPEPVTITAGATSLAAFTIACSPTTGSIRVTTATTGADLDPDGYAIKVDAGAGWPGPVNGATIIANLPAGEHAVALEGVAPNCVIDGASPRQVSVDAGASAEVAFAVTCAALTGELRVTTATTGADLDADGYTVTVDGGPARPVAVQDTILIAGPTAGDHTVALDGVAANCAVDGANPRTVMIASGATAEVAFTVTCRAVPTIGWLRVSVLTTGGPDAGFFVSVAPGGGGTDVPANGIVVLPGGYAPGDYQITLRLAWNCTATGANPRAVTVVAGDTAEVGFAVACIATTGVIAVTAATSGGGLDSNGYLVGVDPLCDDNGRDCYFQWSDVLGPNGTVRFMVNTGYHYVWLEDVAPNCAVSGATSNPIHVGSAETTAVVFAVTCVAVTGSVRVSTATAGVDLDPNGYLVRVDGAPWRSAPVNGVITIPDVWAIKHMVELVDVAANCTVGGANPSTATVKGGDTVDVAFVITCNPMPAAFGILEVATGTSGADLDHDGYTVGVDLMCTLISDGSPDFTPGCEYRLEAAAGVNGTLQFEVPVGEHTVALRDVAPNCAVGGTNPRTVTVTSTARVTFAITCAAVAAGP